MNLVELYRSRPGNYLIHSKEKSGDQFAGGAGKTTQLLYLTHELAGEKVAGKTVIPIYIKMAQLNLRKIGSGILYEYFLEHFHNSVTPKAIDEMLEEATDYDFLLILDGLNEVNDYVMNGQTVYTYIKNDLKSLGKHENVHIIISARTVLDIFENDAFGETFTVKRVSSLDEEQVAAYLQMEEFENMPEPLQKICKNPMLLSMFKLVYEEDKELALSLASRYELMGRFFELDTTYKKDERWSDNLIRVREYVMAEVLPFIAFRVEEALLNIRENEMEHLKYDDILEEILEMCELPFYADKKTVRNVIGMTGFVDEHLTFQHDMIRDYLAVQGFNKVRIHMGNGKRLEEFSKRLSWNMKYIDVNGMEYDRRTRYLDFAEFLYADRMDTLPHTFYYDLAGIYKDLIDRELSVEVGKIALKLTEELEVEGALAAYEAANYYNYLGYCINADEDALIYLERAEDRLNTIPEREKTEECHKLQGKILSNFGSYYYDRKEYTKALEWHQKALVYRIEHGREKEMVHSYRTIMSDYFWMKEYLRAYECYCEGKRMLPDGMIDLELEERVMGSEIKLLQDSKTKSELKEELAEQMHNQIVLVFDGATKSARKNMVMLKSLYGKLESLSKWFQENSGQYSGLQGTVRVYEERCKEIIGK